MSQDVEESTKPSKLVCAGIEKLLKKEDPVSVLKQTFPRVIKPRMGSKAPVCIDYTTFMEIVVVGDRNDELFIMHAFLDGFGKLFWRMGMVNPLAYTKKKMAVQNMLFRLQEKHHREYVDYVASKTEHR